MKTFYPMLFTDLKNYSAKQFVSDLIAGIIVAVIALPLSIALAIASGVTPEAGIYTAIFAGFIVALLGGSNVQIAGPTAAFATIVASIVAKNGMSGLIIATVLAGIILIIMGFLKLGNLIRFIPFTITTGFTAGIAITLVIGQLKDFFGIHYINGATPIETMEKAAAFLKNIKTINFSAVIIGMVSLLILIVWPKVYEKIPASLLAVIVSSVLVKATGMEVNTIGTLFSVRAELPNLQIPQISFSVVGELLPDAVTIAVLAGIESLLSCVVADGMINKRHRSNTELIAQGAANIGSALFGGIPATGAIARTAANIKNGGRTPVSGIVHSVVLLVVLIVLMPYAALIPMPTIAAILIVVAFNMCGYKTLITIFKESPKSDILVLLATLILTVLFDLVVAIEVGVILSCVLFAKRMSEETTIRGWVYKEQDTAEQTERLMTVAKHIRVFELNGPLFFADSDLLKSLTTKKYTKCVIMRMGGVPMIDTDALNGLKKFVHNCKKRNIVVLFSHVNEQPLRVMIKSGLYAAVGEGNFCDNIEDAMNKASDITP